MSNGMFGGPYDFDATNACIDGMVHEIDAQHAALRLACKHIAERGYCPTEDDDDCYERWQPLCELRCSDYIDYADCWERYFMEKGKEDGKQDPDGDHTARGIQGAAAQGAARR